ncbi:unnamed protein product [Prorocentrum cordatum]|uniref:Uncharacterized protein n=1 Tax=Prorocentrum cordatum TaxID=2364126 RepID=A0ABN9XDP9_9DINO|nr:unnamed protein product [Polarella glacialis]
MQRASCIHLTTAWRNYPEVQLSTAILPAPLVFPIASRIADGQLSGLLRWSFFGTPRDRECKPERASSRLQQARVEQGGSGNRRWLCMVDCGLRAWNHTFQTALRESACAASAGSGSRLC